MTLVVPQMVPVEVLPLLLQVYSLTHSHLVDEVVSEIQKKYGKGKLHTSVTLLKEKSMANYDSVEQGDLMIEKIIQHYGKIDILINNA
jgi:NAD(P)-dependent dehydrogenase (short-subunit alcohol dehydrogenase family)